MAWFAVKSCALMLIGRTCVPVSKLQLNNEYIEHLLHPVCGITAAWPCLRAGRFLFVVRNDSYRQH
jgi:hypothetical protein